MYKRQGITCYNYDMTDQSAYFSVSKDDTYSFNFTVPVRELGVYISGYNLISSFSTCRVEITDVDPSVAAQVSVGQGIEDKIEDQYNTSQSSELGSSAPVSYTHLDVYKRQVCEYWGKEDDT